MEALLESLHQIGLAEWLRYSRWGYASTNAAHILSLALLVGAIAAFDLRLVGLWRDIPLDTLRRVLVPVAATGLALTAITGFLLFLPRAPEYAELPLFLIKMGLVAVATIHAVGRRLGTPLDELGTGRQRMIGISSLMMWIVVLVCGRMIAFVAD